MSESTEEFILVDSRPAGGPCAPDCASTVDAPCDC